MTCSGPRKVQSRHENVLRTYVTGSEVFDRLSKKRVRVVWEGVTLSGEHCVRVADLEGGKPQYRSMHQVRPLSVLERLDRYMNDHVVGEFIPNPSFKTGMRTVYVFILVVFASTDPLGFVEFIKKEISG